MKFLVAIAALASSGLVGARALDSGDGHVEARAEVSVIDPKCYFAKNVLPCIETAATSETVGCAIDEYTCWCTNKQAILDAAKECICDECGDDLVTKVLKFAFDKFCKAVDY